MELKSYEGQLRTKELLIQELKENNEIESIKELECSIIVNLKNKQTYEMLYDIKNNNKIKINKVNRIPCELPLAKQHNKTE